MKQLSIRFGGLLAFVFLICFSCTDHEPGRQPRVMTVEAVTTPTAPAVSFRLTIEAGDFPITEYGIVYSLKENANDNVFNTTPTVADTKVVFPLPATNGQHTKVENVVPFVEMYYRAYAVVDGIGVIYGDVMVIDKDGQNNMASVNTLQLLNGNGDGTLNFRLNLSAAGQTITEYGIVLTTRASLQEPIVVPTVENATKIIFPMPATDGEHIHAGFDTTTPNLREVRYRAYAILQNGNIVYGNELILDMD